MNEQAEQSGNLAANSTLDVLLDIELPVTIRFGRTEMALDQLVGLNTGSVIEFERRIDEPVDVLVNGRLVARGEAVMVQGNYGVRISEIASRRERMETAPLASGPAEPGAEAGAL